MDIKDNLIKFKVGCSKGTYIRSLCFDLAKALGYPGHMQDLIRTKSGNFRIEKCYTLEQIESINKDIPMGRMAEPREMAEVVYFLCSDKNTYLTGQKITIDGGYSEK